MKKLIPLFCILTICAAFFCGCGEEDYYALPQYDHEKLTELQNSITSEEEAEYDEIINSANELKDDSQDS